MLEINRFTMQTDLTPVLTPSFINEDYNYSQTCIIRKRWSSKTKCRITKKVGSSITRWQHRK